MPVVWYRQPWFWAVIVAVAAIFIFGMVIAASGPNRQAGGDTTTVVQQPAPAPAENETYIPVPVPAPSASAPSATPAPPVQPARPAQPEKPAKERVIVKEQPKIIHKETVVIRDRAPEKDDASRSADRNRDAAPAEDDPASSLPGPRSGAGPVVALDTFQTTGLPKRMSFNDSEWKANRIVTVVPDKLKDAGTAEDGQALMVSMNATEPYATVLVAIPNETDKYVEYKKQ